MATAIGAQRIAARSREGPPVGDGGADGGPGGRALVPTSVEVTSRVSSVEVRWG